MQTLARGILNDTAKEGVGGAFEFVAASSEVKNTDMS